MRLVSIASGSSGNCVYVGTDTTHLIVDAGIAMKNVVAGINEIGIDLPEINGLLVTHEHSDHMGGVGALSRKYGVPIYSTEGTMQGMINKGVGNLSNSVYCPVKCREQFTIGDITVFPIRISHDTLEPCAYIFESNGKKVAVCTDLGTYDDQIVEDLKNSDILFLEANHDVNMLQVGPYSYPLKRRILSDLGHLSNENSGRLLSSVLHDNVKSIMLAHLSHENNLPELAYETVKLEITMANNIYEGNDFPIYVAKRNELSKELSC